ncbi:alpha/beta hydrolase family protein [Atopomonas sediminilitoris]|uniref:alpha/beta hydrolase family protein n=1 Tax=Atopomonas sediminilitoris TaxID=2919919 RepID=UPI001F4EF655|nr:alpha/beta fold hydrolase [Atopomonas sediminilitoris]MCJ8169526.1 alpha/beta fold hydrolase [Atopomonas sediminilitoris]
MSHTFTLPAADGYAIPLTLFARDDLRDACGDCLLIHPALGVRASFYNAFAEALSQQGHCVLVLEQRGQGSSALRAAHHVDYGYAELCDDLHRAVTWLARHYPQRRRFLLGHSLGGQLGIAYSAMHNSSLHGLVTLASANPHWRHYRGFTRWQLFGLQWLTPVLCRTLGYFPGDRLGFGGREARGLMHDWLQLVRHNRFVALRPDLNQRLQRLRLPLLSIGFNQDSFAPIGPVRALGALLENATIEHAQFDAHRLGTVADHFAWAKKPQAVVQHIHHWLQQQPS